jgi:hypothetical protein
MNGGLIVAGFAAAVSPGAAMPGITEVSDALDRRLNAFCYEPNVTCHHPTEYPVRALNCAEEGSERALCRFETAPTGFYSRGMPLRWSAAMARFSRERDGRWAVVEIFGDAPRAEEIASAVAFESGRTCRDLIDHCLDENANASEQRFSVADVACRPAGRDRAACTLSARQFTSAQVAPARRCSGMLRRGDIDNGAVWRFEPRSRRNSRGRMTCN